MSVHLAKGTRDFLPEAMRARHAVMDTIRSVFEAYGFEPLMTPAIERIDTLAGKYGEEGERLMFKILARGEKAAAGVADLGLRYDLTVPLARVLAMNPGLRLPFKRWQMAPVWRAENPQRGRFREFWQCDADIAGAAGSLADAECVGVAHDALAALGFSDFVVRINDRRVLRAMARAAGADGVAVRETPILVAVDKLDKIGREGVTDELTRAGVAGAGLDALWAILSLPRGHEATLDAMVALLDEEGQAGVATLRQMVAHLDAMGLSRAKFVVDPTLARGLDYYTGPVFEAEILEGGVGSVAGGGRYDGLVGMFSGRPIPCVGVSLGMERLITVLEARGAPLGQPASADVLVTVFDATAPAPSLALAAALRREGLRAEVWLTEGKLGAQFKGAAGRGIRWAAVLGTTELREGTVTLKDLTTGTQQTVAQNAVADVIRGT
jgi:histidyl-tRNA synthetase